MLGYTQFLVGLMAGFQSCHGRGSEPLSFSWLGVHLHFPHHAQAMTYYAHRGSCGFENVESHGWTPVRVAFQLPASTLKKDTGESLYPIERWVRENIA